MLRFSRGLMTVPKRPFQSFFLFMKEVTPGLKKEKAGINRDALRVEVTAMWDQLSPERKRTYEALHEDQLKEYEEAFAKYRAAMRKKKRTGMPEEPLPHVQPFTFFDQELRPAMTEYTSSYQSVTEQLRILWKTLPYKDKKKYYKESREDNVRWSREYLRYVQRIKLYEARMRAQTRMKTPKGRL